MAYGQCSAQATLFLSARMVVHIVQKIQRNHVNFYLKINILENKHCKYVKNLVNALRQLGLVMLQKSVPRFHL